MRVNASERLFLINPTMAEGAERPDSLRGVVAEK